jgi:hypothetical protein
VLGDAPIGQAKDVNLLYLIRLARRRAGAEQAPLDRDHRRALLGAADDQTAYHLVAFRDEIFDVIDALRKVVCRLLLALNCS